MPSDKSLSRYELLENFTQNITFRRCTIFFTSSPTPGMDPGVRCHGMKANPTGCYGPSMNAFWLSRYGLLEDFTANVTGMGTGTTEVNSIAL